ncbi:MAG: response regulator [Roseibium sp.]|uniref:response regulator n=1 Tax=Roseibium sp. TaxID=1936156 RepID=UPI001B130AA9|nr:response regulator [Roseibium sp.]MBO6890897.1 response regulator [Roseibium sp.]MBO6929744.1 response regulator [Roseibium sp.]
MVVHIVEDDAAVADALATVLEGLDHLPMTYPDGETFLEMADISGDDWVIVDLGLPGISGSDVVHMLNGLEDPPSLIVISGRSRMKLKQHLRDLPNLPVLRKPLSVDMITAAMA